MRFPAIAAGAIAVTAALIPASALAGPTSAGLGGTHIYINAAADTDNDVTVTYVAAEEDSTHIVSDDAGIVAKAGVNGGCFQRGPTSASCPDSSSGQGESFLIMLRDGEDTLIFSSPDSPVVYGGAGHDILIGNNMPAPGVGHLGDELVGGKGNDALGGRKGPDLLSGGAGRDRVGGGPGDDQLLGGGGNDKLYARDGAKDRFISCGGGHRDKALIDGKDPQPTGCEIVRRR